MTTEAAAIVDAALDPLCAPQRDALGRRTADGQDVEVDDTAGERARTPAQRRHDALVEVCELVMRVGDLPESGGEPTRMVVTVPFDVLRGELGAGTLDTGERLTPEQTRRRACDARILPVVLGGAGQVLDVGRQQRTVTGSLRRALVARDGGCAFPGCDRKPRWCHGHHIHGWAKGGVTSLDNSVLVCSHHHQVVHRGDWQVRLGSDRLPEFIPPAYIDPDQRPRRNVHLRT
jgi:hypothetical protein